MSDDVSGLPHGQHPLAMSQDADSALAPLAQIDIAPRIFELIEAGGPVVVVLAVMSVIALAIVIVKLWQFGAVRMGDRRPAREALALYREGRAGEAMDRIERRRNPAAQALARALRGNLRGIDETKVREEVVRYGNDVLTSLRSGLRPLETIGSLAPLLGLFGTVLGMIEAFRQLEQAGNQVNPAILSGGIWQALLTTAVGLAVAIPVVILATWLERRVDRLAHDMDDIVTQVFTVDLSREASFHIDETDSHARLARHPAAAAAGD